MRMIQSKVAASKNHKNLSLRLSPNDTISIATTNNNKLSGPPSQEPQHVLHYAQGPAQILPDLYLGGFHTAQRHEMLARLNISCILNVAHEIEPPVPVTPSSSQQQHTVIAYHHLRWTHTQNDLARRAFLEAIRVLEHAHKKKAKVLVHCQSGIERSAALLIAYVLYLSRQQQQRSPLFEKPLSLWEAYDFVRERAPAIRPNMELLYQLSEFERLGSSSQALSPRMTAAAATNNDSTRPRRSGSVVAPRGKYRQQRPRAASFRVCSSSSSSNNSNNSSSSCKSPTTTSTITGCRRRRHRRCPGKEIRKTTVSTSNTTSSMVDPSAMCLVVLIVVMNIGIVLAHPRPISTPSPPTATATAVKTKLCLAPSEPSTPMSPLFLQSLFPIY